MTLIALLAAAAGVAGLAVGSFLNVCIHRLPRRESLAWPASHCPHCQAPIRWRHNVPLLGYLVLGGRCADCRAPIPWRYPIVEAATGVLFAAHVPVFGPTGMCLVRIGFAAALLVLFAIDLEHRILPNRITMPGIIVGLICSVWLPPGIESAILGALVGGGTLYLLGEGYYRLRGDEGLGMGDVKMLAMIGAFLSWKATLLTLVLSSFVGALVGVAFIVSGRGGMKYALPFGTFLALGALASSLAGDPIIDWYASFYR